MADKRNDDNPGHSVTYLWYAGDIFVQDNGIVRVTPIEFGATNLIPADRIKQPSKGAIGALIIEPEGATWLEDDKLFGCSQHDNRPRCSRASATVFLEGGKRFREFALLFQDDLNLRCNGCGDPDFPGVIDLDAVNNLADSDDAEDSGQKGLTRAVLAVDRSLQERSPGSYETSAALRRPGLYDVAFFLDSPRTVHCFEVEVAPNPALIAARRKAQPLQVKPLISQPDLTVGKEHVLKFRLTDPTSQQPREGLADVHILTFRAPGFDQKRQKARHSGDGVYEVTLRPDRAGSYFAFLACPSLGVDFNRNPFLVLRAREEEPAKNTNMENE